MTENDDACRHAEQQPRFDVKIETHPSNGAHSLRLTTLSGDPLNDVTVEFTQDVKLKFRGDQPGVEGSEDGTVARCPDELTS